MSDLILRALTGQEPDIEQLLDDIDAVLQAAYRAPSWKFRVQRFLRVQPGGWVVAQQENEVVAVGGCIAYPDAGFGWIGLIATSPSSQRHGAGRTVTQWAVDHLKSLGCASVLDASLAGAPLYVRMGFDDVGISVLMESSVVPIPSGSEFVTTIARTDVADLGAYDLPRFGADRSRLLDVLAHDHPGRGLVYRNGGTILGYGIAQDDAIGPVVADNDDSCRAIMTSLLALDWAQPPRVVLPPESPYRSVLESLGFVELRSLRRQQFGRVGPLPGQRTTMVAQTSFGEG